MPEFLKNQRKTDDLKKSTVYFLHLRSALNAYVTYFVQIHLTEGHFWGGTPGLYWCFQLCVVQKKHLNQYRYLSPIKNCTHCFPLMVCAHRSLHFSIKHQSSHLLHAIGQYSVLFVLFFLNAKPQFGMSQHVNLSLNLLDKENLFLCCSDWNTSEHQSFCISLFKHLLLQELLMVCVLLMLMPLLTTDPERRTNKSTETTQSSCSQRSLLRFWMKRHQYSEFELLCFD